ncbi:MAG: acetyl-CoA carboxylase carboxyltransferase subunit beta [Planctomycetes bacterium]|nr:acetyl-CoA carboxylase carboxyltransferase subunit beta [Planctomycetota bacterium]
MGWERFRKKRDVPEGLWLKCKKCNETLFKKDLEAALSVCVHCGYHFTLNARERIATLLDPDSFTEMWADLRAIDRLGFVDKEPYPTKMVKAEEKSGSTEAAMAGAGLIDGLRVSVCVLDFSYMGGSMGTVVGEKVTCALELAAEEGIPCITVACSGGARMHEGALSLMQMAKTSGAIQRLHERGGLFISLLTNPTTGGVTASFAALGDVIYAEPEALIGFAGPRVIQETLRTELPEGFQRSEFLLERGFIDRIVARKDLRATIVQTIRLLAPQG